MRVKVPAGMGGEGEGGGRGKGREVMLGRGGNGVAPLCGAVFVWNVLV